MNLNVGVRSIKGDEDVLVMVKHVQEYPDVEVFVELGQPPSQVITPEGDVLGPTLQIESGNIGDIVNEGGITGGVGDTVNEGGIDGGVGNTVDEPGIGNTVNEGILGDTINEGGIGDTVNGFNIGDIVHESGKDDTVHKTRG